MAAEEGKLQVEVAYALPQQQCLLALGVTPGCTALEALRQSGLLRRFPEIDPASARIGVFGEPLDDPAAYVLADGDRVEVYRPLAIDPRDARRRRAGKTR
jgi:hypothetical protein